MRHLRSPSLFRVAMGTEGDRHETLTLTHNLGTRLTMTVSSGATSAWTGYLQHSFTVLLHGPEALCILPAIMSRLLLRNCPRRVLQAPLRRSVRGFASSTTSAPQFDWEDPLLSKSLLTSEELAVGETAERYCHEQLLPRVLRMVDSFSSFEIKH